MNQIANFVQVRADGRLIPATMAVREMLALGWGPSKVIALRWTHDGRQIEVEVSSGIHGIVVPGGNFVAALYGEDAAGPAVDMVIFSPDGSIHGKVSSPISISGNDFRGAFGWFEPAMTPRMNTFGAVFQADEQTTLRCDIDASASALIDAVKVH